MRHEIPKPEDVHLSPEQYKKFFDFITGSDLDFYEEFTIHLSEEEQENFFRENPKFMSNYPISRGKIDSLKDKNFRGILRKIERYEGEKR